MESAKPCEYTTKDIFNLPEGQRAELLDGRLYMMTPPNLKHQEISMIWRLISRLCGRSRLLTTYIRKRQINLPFPIVPPWGCANYRKDG